MPHCTQCGATMHESVSGRKHDCPVSDIPAEDETYPRAVVKKAADGSLQRIVVDGSNNVVATPEGE